LFLFVYVFLGELSFNDFENGICDFTIAVFVKANRFENLFAPLAYEIKI